MPFVNFQSRPIFYDNRGLGPAIVFLHGLMESHEIWNSFANSFSNEFQSILVDLPGHGQSATIAPVHTMELMADCVKTSLDELHIQECVLVGHSMGGYVSLSFADKFPEYVKGLVLFHSSALPDSEEGRKNRQRTIEFIQQNKLGFILQFIPSLFAAGNTEIYQMEIQMLVKMASAMAPDAIIAAQRGMMERPSYLNVLSKIQAPVLFIIGKQDSRISAESYFSQIFLPSHAETLILENVGHNGHIEAFPITSAVVRHFAQRAFELNSTI
ncbi:MAG TPA: alpha/beta fold hydrolase [Bacteroidales bacterium]|jgi:pimeloyl-ACP methyl ester carboxylesterase|nr:alpha/beta fold hydrolase [Bacteroidales bacterium]